MRHTEKQKVWATQRKKGTTKTVPEKHLAYLLDKDFKTTLVGLGGGIGRLELTHIHY